MSNATEVANITAAVAQDTKATALQAIYEITSSTAASALAAITVAAAARGHELWEAVDEAVSRLDPPTAAYVRNVLAACADVAGAAWTLARALYALTLLVAVPAGLRLWEHFSSQPHDVIVVELAAVLALFLLWQLRRWIRTSPTLARWGRKVRDARRSLKRRRDNVARGYRSFIASVAAKSRAAAALLPHAVFLGAVSFLGRVFPVYSEVLWASPQLAAACFLYRAALADGALRLGEGQEEAAEDEYELIPGSTQVRRRVATPAQKAAAEKAARRRSSEAREAVREQLRFWVVLAFAFACRGVVLALPFAPSDWTTSGLAPVARRLAVARGVGLAWLHVSPLGGAGFAFAALEAFFGHLAPPEAAEDPSAAARWLGLLQGAVAALAPGAAWAFGGRMNGLRTKCAAVASDTDGWRAAAVGLVALMTVGPANRLGKACVMFGVPGLAALRCCASGSAADAKARRFLGYWAAVGAREAALLAPSVLQLYGYVPLRHHLDVLLALWLQLPLLEGGLDLRRRARARFSRLSDEFRDKRD